MDSRAYKQSIKTGDSNAQLIAIWGFKQSRIGTCSGSASGVIGAAWSTGIWNSKRRMLAVQYQMESNGWFGHCVHTPLIWRSAMVSA